MRIDEAMRKAESDKEEARALRRYAVLQAAAVIHAPMKSFRRDEMRQSVEVALDLLAEIERQEKER